MEKLLIPKVEKTKGSILKIFSKKYYMKIPKKSLISNYAEFIWLENVNFSGNLFIDHNVVIQALGGIDIGSDVSIARDVKIITYKYDTKNINMDGNINVLDVILLLELVLYGEYSGLADLNADGVLNVLDVIALINIILGN